MRKYNCAQYVPIKETVRALLKIPKYVNQIFNDKAVEVSEPGVYARYQDSSRFKSSPINSDPSKQLVLQFQLYEDGMGITNPFAANSSLHSSAMFYFSLLNIAPKLNSRHSNMHLVAACNNLDMKNDDGLQRIFDCITDEIAEFESVGVECDVAGLGLVRIYGTLAQFTADNLGLNQMFGLIECFSVDYWYSTF